MQFKLTSRSSSSDSPLLYWMLQDRCQHFRSQTSFGRLSKPALAAAAHGVARAPSSAYVAVRVRKSILCMSMRYHIPSSGQNSCNSRKEAPSSSVNEQRTEI